MKMNCAKFGSVWEEVKHIKSLQMDGGDQKKTHVDLRFRWAKNAAQIGIACIGTPFGQTFQGGKKWQTPKSNKTSPSYRP